ncbi:MAG TPA: hypothetical protein VFQ79_20220 [Bryobacteraceae bacterium]|nr:hypothetical protein [Bryobacteraceae bacterium]
MASQDSSPKPENFRPRFTSYIQTKRNQIGPGRYHALEMVSKINDGLERDGVPMTQEHFEIATGSLDNGDCLPKFVFKEHRCVMASEGRGVTYGAGRFFHSMLEGIAQPDKSKW